MLKFKIKKLHLPLLVSAFVIAFNTGVYASAAASSSLEGQVDVQEGSINALIKLTEFSKDSSELTSVQLYGLLKDARKIEGWNYYKADCLNRVMFKAVGMSYNTSTNEAAFKGQPRPDLIRTIIKSGEYDPFSEYAVGDDRTRIQEPKTLYRIIAAAYIMAPDLSKPQFDGLCEIMAVMLSAIEDKVVFDHILDKSIILKEIKDNAPTILMGKYNFVKPGKVDELTRLRQIILDKYEELEAKDRRASASMKADAVAYHQAAASNHDSINQYLSVGRGTWQKEGE
ncbi:hypothetical protein [Candidatus Finniella inopinata]|uniref:Uncharacterized protein n=1 Tax=Candidatus Finniella inopinata TaxID=1696036 RepID=A0A4Q7DHV6_9PROT|nr:hypothetical protein [Candidatus Finniella inopinata]RZI45888.1 hypothetical protein EQU50_05515 [Candidatus Finniella inopinata]